MMAKRTPHQNVTFDLPTKSGDDTTGHGYLALPDSGTGPGVLVIQEWWGLTDHIKDICDRLAGEGFVALAPDLYGGWVAHDAAEAAEMVQKLPAEEAARELAGAVDHLLGRDEVTSRAAGAIGFCMGGGFVLGLAAQQGDKIAAAVPFYGVGKGVPGDFTHLTAAVQGHYANLDQMFPPEAARAQAEQIRAESGAAVEYFFYDADHAFHNDENPAGHYDADAAALAWQRAVAFLKQHVE